MTYKRFLDVFNGQLGSFKFRALYEDSSVFTSEEQRKIINTRILYPNHFITKLVDGEEPTDGQIRTALKEMNNLYQIFVDHPIPKAKNPVTGENRPEVRLLPFKLTSKNVISAKIVEVKNPLTKLGITQGQRFLGIVTDVRFLQKFWMYL